jgi:Bacterial SH3 domain
MTFVKLKTLMTSAGVLALTTGMAAAAPAVVQSSVNLRTGPGTGYEVIAAMPGGAAVDVMGCSGSWCQVNFDGTLGFASRNYLDIGVATGPAYERGYAYGSYEPGYRYGYAPGYGYSESSGYGGSVSYNGEREFRGARGLRDERELRGESREGGGRTAIRGEQREQGRGSGQIQGNNPMLNPKNEAPAARQSRAESPRRGLNDNTNVRANGSNANATTGAGNDQDHGPNFIGSGAQFRDNHP